ncbi:MAG: hypothetical protein AAFY98_01485 [Verrucomicrobiota bacterium]
MSGSRDKSAVIVDSFACADELGLVFPKGKRYQNLNRPTLTAIWNAWLYAGLIAPDGSIWVRFNRLHTILRVGSMARARKLITYHVPDHFIQKRGPDYCLHGRYVILLMDMAIQASGGSRRSDYARFSEKVYRKLRDSPEADKRRGQFHYSMSQAKKKLKKKRIKDLKLTTDELTGESLDPVNSDFSHIRCASIFPKISTESWNGLIVNKGTHAKITTDNVLDENDLLSLCKRQKWTTSWLPEFQKRLELIG